MKFLDPLHIIFEKHFYDPHNRDDGSLCEIIVRDYLDYLKYSGAIVLLQKENQIMQEVQEEVKEIMSTYKKENILTRDYLKELQNIEFLREEAQKRYFALY